MLVIGVKIAPILKVSSSLSECRADVYHIETAKELKEEWFRSIDRIGITAGASTPDWIIKEVISKMEELSKDMDNQEIATNEEEGELNYENTLPLWKKILSLKEL